MQILTVAANSYVDIFKGYLGQFTTWGQWLFLSLLTINIVWMALWSAFDRHSLAETMPGFLKRFIGVGIFYTLMLHPGWMTSVLQTAGFMGKTLTHHNIDPSSIIETGISIGNKLMGPVQHTSLLRMGFGVLVVTIVYLCVLYVFIAIAIDLATTLVMTTALISMATLFLSFAALETTAAIARQTLDVILSQCVKLLGLYVVVAAGCQTMEAVARSIPVKVESFDAYAWLIAVALLFHALSKALPAQLARIVTGAFQETRISDVGAMAMAAVNYAKMASPHVQMAGNAASTVAKIAGSSAFNAGAHFNQAVGNSGNAATGLAMATVGTASHLGKAVGGHLSDHFKSMASKITGGMGHSGPIDGIASRMHQSAQNIGATGSPKPGSAPLASAIAEGFSASNPPTSK